MSARPKRYWDTRQFRLKWDRIEIACGDDDLTGPWVVCACHGRNLLAGRSWRGLVKR